MTTKKRKTSFSARAEPVASIDTDRATAYARAVVAGQIVAGPHVRNACRRHLDDLQHGPARGLTFDPAAAARAIRFFETKLKLSEGQFEGLPLLLHPSQAFKVGSIFGWKRANGTRRFRRAYVEEGKGNGKSPIAGGIGLYGMMADKEPGAQIYAAGATKDQAGILFRDAVNMVDKSPDLKSRIKPSGGPGREYNMAVISTGSFFRPISREAKKTGSGPRPHFALCDEVHEHPDRGVMEMLERGFKFRRQPLLFMITNSGTDRNSICWEEHEHAVKVAAGNAEAKDEDPAYVPSADYLATDEGLSASFGTAFPSGRWEPGAVRIQYLAGYDTTPPAVAAAMLLMVGDLYGNRGTVETGVRAAAVSVPMSTTVENLLAPYRVFR